MTGFVNTVMNLCSIKAENSSPPEYLSNPLEQPVPESVVLNIK
jgi:hypothetical protein